MAHLIPLIGSTFEALLIFSLAIRRSRPSLDILLQFILQLNQINLIECIKILFT